MVLGLVHGRPLGPEEGKVKHRAIAAPYPEIPKL
jgi:hypothetical protein